MAGIECYASNAVLALVHHWHDHDVLRQLANVGLFCFVNDLEHATSTTSQDSMKHGTADISGGRNYCSIKQDSHTELPRGKGTHIDIQTAVAHHSVPHAGATVVAPVVAIESA
jgi:hypothetical protein